MLHTWAELETALRDRPRWRRIGREWHGPCPVRGTGRDTCWFAEGERASVRGGCRTCGGRLSSQAFREHLAAIVGDQVTPSSHLASSSTPAQVSTRPKPASTAPADVWAAGVAPDDTPARTYLVERRRVWGASTRLPASIRWLPRAAAENRRGLFPLPVWAAGVVLYRYAAPGEVDTLAVQYEPVGAIGERGKWIGPKRPAVTGSRFGGQAGPLRVFEAAAGAAESLSWSVCEGPLDALAVAWLSTLKVCGADPGGAVVGVPGTATLARAVAPPGRRMVAWMQRDGAGMNAAHGLRCRIVVAPGVSATQAAPAGMDWADAVRRVWWDELVEQEAMRDG